jgi:transposase-like protein
MKQEPLKGLLKGTVEVDEAYVGGKPRRGDTRRTGREGRGTTKAAVIALVERGGRVRAHHIPRVNANILKSAIRDMVDPSARIMTDEFRSYRGIGGEFAGGHHTVTHSKGEYVRGDASTNQVESFFSLLKRGVMGSFHHISRKHLNRYCDEFAYRWSERKVTDQERTLKAIRAGEGKRLTYKTPVAEIRNAPF